MQNTTPEPDDKFLINYGVYLFKKELNEGFSFSDITTKAKQVCCKEIVPNYKYDRKTCELICKELEVFANCFPFADIVGSRTDLYDTFKDCHLLKALYKEGILPIEKRWVIKQTVFHTEWLVEIAYFDGSYCYARNAKRDINLMLKLLRIKSLNSNC